MASNLASLWNKGLVQLGNGLFAIEVALETGSVLRPIGHFRNPKTLTFKMRLARCTTFLVKMSFIWMRMKKPFPYRRLSSYPRFETEARGNSEMAYYTMKHGTEQEQAMKTALNYCTHKFHSHWTVLHSSLVIFRPHVDIFSLYEVYFTFAFLDRVRRNEDFVQSRYVISRILL